jgi:hypothetical protein
LRGIGFDRTADRTTAAFAANLRPSLYGLPDTDADRARQRHKTLHQSRGESPAREGRSGSPSSSRSPSPTGRTAPRLRPDGGSARAQSDVSVGYGYRHAAAASALQGLGTVFDRLTDVRGFTGTHRERFRNDGTGRGLEGRDGATDYDYVREQHMGKGTGRRETDPQTGKVIEPLADAIPHHQVFNAPIPAWTSNDLASGAFGSVYGRDARTKAPSKRQ